MARLGQLSNNIKELRVLFCQSSPASPSTRSVKEIDMVVKVDVIEKVYEIEANGLLLGGTSIVRRGLAWRWAMAVKVLG
ncbi:hypothetical protein Tco_0694404 [Tanacetum coccineum]